MELSIVNRTDLEFQRIEAEFYQPKFLNAKKKAGEVSLNHLRVKVLHPAEVKRIYSENGSLQIVLAQNVRDNIMNWSTVKKMDESVKPLISRNELQEGDVLVTRSGANYGQTSVITNEPKENKLYACADVLILKPGAIGGPLLSTYLNTSVGKLLMNRGVYGAGQPHVAPSYISKISFPKYLIPIKEQIENIIYESRRLQKQSKILYEKSTKLLGDALGFEFNEFKEGISFISSFSKVIGSHRLDSNHFKPKFDQLLDHIKANFDYLHLGTSVVLNRRGVQPVYIHNGTKKVVTSQHITDTHLDYDNFESTSNQYFAESTQAHIKYGDILTYTTGAYVGQTNVYLLSEPALASNHVNIVRLRSSEIDPTYIAFVMNSIVGKLQTEKHIRGSAQAELYPKDLKKFIIPLLSQETMATISQNIKDSLEASRKSKELLKQAKQEVEKLIEKSAENV